MEQAFRIDLTEVLRMLRNDVSDVEGAIAWEQWGTLEDLAHDIVLCGQDLEKYARRQQAKALLNASKE